uniref:dockerin type I domain-containing protein n=1 Tax=Novipirellula sp. TaxID=2795430 RepID=UPI003567E653
DVDNDSYPDIINAGGVSTVRPAPISVFLNKTGEDPMVLLPPAARTRIGGDPIDLQIYFGFPIDVTGTPRIALQLGDNTVYADYVSGSGTPFLDFRYTVADTDIDLDGVQLASNVIDLNGGTLTDPIGGEAVLEFPNLPFEGVFVNAVGPLVSGITRQDTTPTDVDSVRFEVKFAEDVTGVDAADFDVVMNAGDLSGATIDSVVGSGTTYTVTILTGTGSGTLALSVKDDASITNTGGHPLARGYFGGEVYTLRRGTADPIEYYYTDQHSDYRPVWNDGEMILAVHGSADVIPGGEIASNRIYTYADSNALVERSEDAAYDFVGVSAGESLYVLPSSQLPGVPYLGFTNGDVPTDLFASYVPDDPFITSSTPRPYIRYEMTDMRSSSGGEFSMWSTPSSGPRVYMTTSDGISSDDVLWSSGHLHRTLGFSKPGIYEVDVFLSGYLDVNANGTYDEGFDPYYESGIQTMVFNVDTLGAVDDSFTVIEGETLNGDVSLNDDWHESMGDYTASVETEPANGTLTLNADGSFAYEPNEGFTGTDHFTYLVTNQRGGFTSASVTLVAPSINVQLVPVALPSDPSVTDLPDGIDSVPVGSSYFVEVWVQDKNDQLDGIAGGHIDIQYTTDLLDALNLNHQNFNELQSGVIHEAAGLIDDFGGGTLTQGQSLAPQWARLGYVEVIATSAGDAEYRLLPGALPFARFGGGNVGFDDVNLSDIATVTHTESWRLDLTVVRDPSDTLDDGSVDQIPASVSYVHEWEPFYVEVYLSNVTDVDGVETITFDLSYDTSITTALQFKPGPSFEFPDGLPVVDDIAGTVSNIELIATKLGLGTEPVLLGHILFRPTDSDDVAMDQAGEQTLGPHTLGLAASAVTEVAGQQVNVMMGETPATAMWAVPYDVDDSDQIDFADFAIFAAVFGASVENSETPFTSWADFDGSGLIDFDDLAFFDANQGLTVDDDKLLSFSSVYPTPELALPQAITPPELTQATLQMFSSFGPFNNGSDAYDVNNSGGTSPLDALLIINALNSQTNAQPYFLDVNGDGRTTPLDALWVINRLDRTSPEQASATDEALSTSSVSTQPFWSENNKDSEGEDLIALLAADQRLF